MARTPLRIAVRWGEDAVAGLLRERGANPAAITAADRALGAYLSGQASRAPDGIAPSKLDEMLSLAIQCGHLDTMRRLLDAGARVDGDPAGEEIPAEPYAEIVRILLAAGATVPDGIGVDGIPWAALVAELGVAPPA